MARAGLRRWRMNHSIWSAYTFGIATSTVSGRFRMIGLSGVGCHSSMTASQISSANSTSVAEKLSGEYWNRRLVPGRRWARSRTHRVPRRAMATISGFSSPNTTRRWAGEVEL